MISTVQNICVFDLETSGLSAEKNAILEIACCPFNNELVDLKEYESGVTSIYDNREISEQALQANGITMQQIENGRDSKEVADELMSYLSKLSSGRNKVILAGHNIVRFDVPFLDNFMRYHKHDISKYVNMDFHIDTMWFARLKWTELTNYKLGTCCEETGVELVNAHRAINDTRANKDLLKDFIRSLRSDHKQSGEDNYKRPVFQF